MINKKRLRKTINDLKALREPFSFTMDTHYALEGKTASVSIIGYSALMQTFGDVKAYYTPHLVSGELVMRYRSWAFDYFNVKHDVYDYLFSKHWARKDNTLEGAILRLEYYLEHGLPKSWYQELHTKNFPLSYRR
jgi:hypothetical protein